MRSERCDPGSLSATPSIRVACRLAARRLIVNEWEPESEQIRGRAQDPTEPFGMSRLGKIHAWARIPP